MYIIVHIKNPEIKDLKIRAKTLLRVFLKSFEENIRGKLHDNGLGTGFLDMTLKAQARKEKLGDIYHQN